MDDGFAVEVIEVGEDPGFEFSLGSDADATEQGPRHFGEEAFHQIEPGAVLRRRPEITASQSVFVSAQPQGFSVILGRARIVRAASS